MGYQKPVSGPEFREMMRHLRQLKKFWRKLELEVLDMKWDYQPMIGKPAGHIAEAVEWSKGVAKHYKKARLAELLRRKKEAELAAERAAAAEVGTKSIGQAKSRRGKK